MSVDASAVPARVVEPTDVLWRRAGALVVDVLVTVGAGAVLDAVVSGDPGRGARILSFLVAWLAVFVVAPGLTGASPGKLLAGVRVVDRHGRTPGLARTLVRSCAWVVDGFPYVVPVAGFVAAADDGDGRRVGDRWAGTYVVAAELTGQPPFPTVHRADGSPPQRLRTVTSAPPPRTLAAPAAAHLPALDRARGTYTRWDAEQAALVEFDEQARAWRPVAPAAERALELALEPVRRGRGG